MEAAIESIDVKNIGVFEELHVSFNGRMNVIAGANGVGKTLLLRCLTHSFTFYNGAELRFGKDAAIHTQLHIGDKKYIVGADKISSKDQDYREFGYNSTSLVRESVPEGYQGKSMGQEAFFYYPLYAIGAYRSINYVAISGTKREAGIKDRRVEYTRGNPLYLSSSSVPNVKQWLINRYFVIEKEWAKLESENWTYMVDKLKTISPAGESFFFSRIERDLEPVFSLNGRECYFEELPSGYKSVLSIVFSIIDWIEGVFSDEDALIERAHGTVLIDEIDAHLHPSWQMIILDILQSFFPNLQFIITTHSPYVIMSAKEGELLWMKTDSHQHITPDEQSYGNWRLVDIVHDLMMVPNLGGKDVPRLLIELGHSFEEGNIEKYRALLHELATMLNPKDPLLQVYRMKLSTLLLKQDDQSN